MAGQLRIGHLSTFYHTAFVLMGTGWLAESGIDASWKLFPSGPDIMKAMGAGEIDLAYIGLPPAMIGIDRGMPVKCIAGGHVEGTVLVAQGKYLSIDEIGDEKAALEQFAGKIVGCPPKGSIHDIIIRDLLADMAWISTSITSPGRTSRWQRCTTARSRRPSAPRPWPWACAGSPAVKS